MLKLKKETTFHFFRVLGGVLHRMHHQESGKAFGVLSLHFSSSFLFPSKKIRAFLRDSQLSGGDLLFLSLLYISFVTFPMYVELGIAFSGVRIWVESFLWSM